MIQRLIRSPYAAGALRLALVLLCMVFLAGLGLAQDAAPAAEEAEALSIAQLIVMSGFIGWVICALSVVMLALVIENFVTLNRERLAPPELIDEVPASSTKASTRRRWSCARTSPTCSRGSCAAGIAKIGHPFEVIQRRSARWATRSPSSCTRRSAGSPRWPPSPHARPARTVQGMVASFHTIASTQNPTPSDLAGGIYVALLTTLEGLIVAIPATAAFAYLRNRLVRSTIEVGAIVEDLFERFRQQA